MAVFTTEIAEFSRCKGRKIAGQCGFCRHIMLNWCEKNGVFYFVGFAKSSRLPEWSNSTICRAERPSCLFNFYRRVLLFLPKIPNPLGWPHIVVNFFPSITVCGLIRVGSAVKHNDARIERLAGFNQIVEGENRSTVLLETDGPMFWPKHHLRADAVSQISLRRLETGKRPIPLPKELLVNECALIRYKTKYRWVADRWSFRKQFAAQSHPVADNGNFVRFKPKKIIKVSGYQNIQVQKQAWAFNGQVFLKQAKLSPSRVKRGRIYVNFRNRKRQNAFR